MITKVEVTVTTTMMMMPKYLPSNFDERQPSMMMMTMTITMTS